METRLINSLSSPRCQIIKGVLLLLIISILAVACGGADAPALESAADGAMEAPAAPTYVPAEPSLAEENAVASRSSVDDTLALASGQVQESRVIIYTGQISLVVRDTREAVSAITELAVEQGGYVSGSNIYQANDVPRGALTIRIPAERYQETLARLRALAVRVESENSGAQDVTEEFTDLQARKTNLEKTEEALQELLEERKRVGSTSDILEVYRELTNIRGQIEQIEGRLRYLANQSALSTITIELIPDVLYQPVSVGGWEPQGVAKEALQALVAAFQGLTNVLIWLVVFGLPLLVVFLIPIVIVVWLIRWWWRRYKARRTPVAAAASPDPPSPGGR